MTSFTKVFLFPYSDTSVTTIVKSAAVVILGNTVLKVPCQVNDASRESGKVDKCSLEMTETCVIVS